MNNLKLDRFAKFAWGVLAYNVVVILWGAVVRATGSGAGCGEHWPLCNGAVIPAMTQTTTLIEFTHRIMSGLVLVLAAVYLVWARRSYPRGHRVRLGAGLVVFFTILEALVGAGLVLFGLTAQNTSEIRALVVAVHLVNTMLLVASLSLTAWWVVGASIEEINGVPRWLLTAGAVGMLALGASGAITALGDTLFPAASLADGIRQELDPAAHFLVRLRIYHPLLALIVLVGVAAISTSIRRRSQDELLRWLANTVLVQFVAQLAVGAVNVFMLAPVWLQVVHLLITNLIWIGYVLLAYEVGWRIKIDQPMAEIA